jgi:hypothetical protein
MKRRLPTAGVVAAAASVRVVVTMLCLAMSARASAADKVMRATSPPAWLPGEEQQGPCDMDQQGRLVYEEEDDEASAKLRVEVGQTGDGAFTYTQTEPAGSYLLSSMGVTFTLASKTYGFCRYMATTGWRLVRLNAPLADRLSTLMRPVQDVDRDGSDELVILGCGDFRNGTSEGEGPDCAIWPTAYDRHGQQFIVDAVSTRTLRLKMADAYQRAAASKEGYKPVRKYYARAAAILKRLASVPIQE